MFSDNTSPVARNGRSRRAFAAVSAAVVALSGLGLAQSPAQAEGFFDTIRNALFGRIVEVRPSYAALPREPSGVTDRRTGHGEWGRTFSDLDRPGRERIRHRHATAFREVTPGSGGRGTRTMCVRLCDGYAFPLGRLGRDEDASAQQASCSASCPGTQTALYRLGSGSSLASPAKATSTADGTPYRQLATAFLFRKERVAQCSCQGADNVATRLPIQADETLRKGDIVVAADGSGTAFDGTEGGRKVFTDFRTSPTLSRSDRRQVDKTLGVSQRAAVARAFAERMQVAALDGGSTVSVSSTDGRTREASLRPVAAPAGSGAGVRAFSVVTPTGSEGIRTVGGAVYVIR